MNIEWLERAEFWRRFDADYLPASRLLEGRAWFEQPGNELRRAIPVSPVATPEDGDDLPGPCQRWYGALGGDLLVLTWYERESDLAEVCHELDAPVADRVAAAMHELFGVEVTRDPMAG
jgi:hypothetical protein